jgi:bifunctional enzyme CysN/CysC
MVTAASHADALLLVLEANSGVKPQTLNHLRIAKILGIDTVVVAINKMDLVRHSQKTFLTRANEISNHLDSLGFPVVHIIPVSGLTGVNIVKRGKQMTWWDGPTVLEAFDSASTKPHSGEHPVCVVQDVRRIDGGGRRYLASLLKGELVASLKLKKAGTSTIVGLQAIASSGEYKESLLAPAEVMVELDADIDLQRGDVLSRESAVQTSQHFAARVVWMDATAGHPGRRFDVRLGHSHTRGSITRSWQVGEDLETKAGEIGTLEENSVSLVNIELSAPLAFASFTELPELGRFILVDPVNGATLAAGTA